ncbi:MAG TPA: amino acid permease [Bacillota bacterium]|jgi:APA family basic amino acid/polyamine antiporter
MKRVETVEFTQKEEKQGLRRAIGTWGSFTWGYADVGADVYVALGLVMGAAHGGTPAAFAMTGLIYVFIGLAYTELAATYPVAGGGHYYTLRGLGDFLGFTSGWALLLDFTIDVSLFALSAAGYVNFFFPALQKQPWLAIEAVLGIGFLIFLNLRGIRESSRMNEIFCAADMVNESVIILFGFLFAFNPDFFTYQFVNQFPSRHDFLYGASIAIISFVGLESISQAAEETLRPATIVPRTSLALIFTVLIYALSFSILSLGILPWQVIAANQGDPVAVLAKHIPIIGFIAGPFTAILAATLVFASANTGVMGYSRITWSMSNFRLLPKWFSAVHPVHQTPYRTILVFSMIAIAEVILASLSANAYDTLGNMYAFGAVTGYILVLISLIRLRFADPFSPRPYKVPINFKTKFRGHVVDVPIMGFLGLAGSIFIWALVVATHAIGRIAGPAWILLGYVAYFVFRRREGLPAFGNVKRDWEGEQIRVLTDAGEQTILDQYKAALERRDRLLAEETEATKEKR